MLTPRGEQYDLTVRVFTRPNLREGEGEMMMYMGKGVLDNIFDICKVDEKTTSIHFEYPERWANILELRALVYRIPILYPNIKKVTIVTHSVYIIQCVQSEHIRVYDNPSEYPDGGYSDLTVRYCPLPESMAGLYVATPEKFEKVF